MEEPNLSIKCALCESSLLNKTTIHFTCAHEYCFYCLPYLLYFSLERKKGDLSCRFCENGYFTLNFADLSQILSLELQKKENESRNFNKCAVDSCKLCSEFADHFCEQGSPPKQTFSRAENKQKVPIFQHIREELKQYQDSILGELSRKVEEFDTLFSTSLDKIVSLLKDLRQKTIDNVINQYEKLSQEFSFMEDSLLILSHDLEKHSALPPSKFSILKKLLSKESSEFRPPRFSINFPENSLLDEMYSIIRNLSSLQTETFDLRFKEAKSKKSNFFFVEREKKVKPKTLQANPLKELEGSSFHVYGWKKSGISTVFSLNDETYLLAPLPKSQNVYAFQAYNVTTAKKSQIIQLSEFYISVLSYFECGDKKWVYVADSGGNLHVFDCNAQFENVCSFNDNEKGIAAVSLFEDRFNELSEDYPEIYALISFVDPAAPIVIYDVLRGKRRASLITGPKKLCLSLLCHQDSKLRHTSLILGYSKSAVQIYNLRLRCWTAVKIVTGTNVSAMRVFEDGKGDFMLYLTERNNGTVFKAKLDSGVVLASKVFEELEDIYDFCFAGKLVVLAATNKKKIGLIKILDLDLQDLGSREFPFANQSPINLHTFDEIKCPMCPKHLVFCMYGGKCQNFLLKSGKG